MFELCHVRNQFDYGVDPVQARQEVINRLGKPQLPAGVTPEISPQSPTGEIFRYVLTNPRDKSGPGNLRSQRSEVACRTTRWSGCSAGCRGWPTCAVSAARSSATRSTPTRPECSATASRSSSSRTRWLPAMPTSGGEYIVQGGAAYVVRSLGLIGGGRDPIEKAMGMQDPVAARDYLRAEEQRRVREIRQIVLSADQQRAGPRRRRGRRRPAATTPGKGDRPRIAQRGTVPLPRPGRRRRPPDPAGPRDAEPSAEGFPGEGDPRRPRAAAMARRRRRRPVRRADAERRAIAAGLGADQGPGRAAQR